VGELISHIVWQDDVPAQQAFEMVGRRHAMAVAIVSVCVIRAPDAVTRVAIGGAGPTVTRLPGAEQFASTERRLSVAALREFARLVAKEVKPVSDQLSTAEFRRRATSVLARRALESLI
jgi:CO/xanthine dehydrogenase FAD-binding subunit